MGDLVWFIIIGAMFALLSLLFIWMGLQIWKNQKMDLIISYHCDKVTEDNKRAYCALSGIGIFMIGVGFGLSGILAVVLRSVSVFIPMAVGLGSGIALLTAAVIKYNR